MSHKTNQNEEKTIFAILMAVSFGHLLNDSMQSILISVYPILKTSHNLTFGQIGLITLVWQFTASIFQPLIGYYTDKKPKPYSLVVAMGFTFVGLMLLAFADDFYALLFAAAVIGIGSSIFHPESSRIARSASGGKHGFAQSFFQVGGNVGTALGPLLAAFIILPYGQRSVALFSGVALLGMVILFFVGRWYKKVHLTSKPRVQKHVSHLPRKKIIWSVVILILLIFSKFFYTVSISNYYVFYLTQTFGISFASAQIHLFAFLISTAIGIFFGGIISDKMGRRFVIWVSILGVLPFTMALPYANLFWTGILSVIIGLIISSAFSAILVYAVELIPGKVGTISGFFFGLAFGMAGIGAALLGKLADLTSIKFVYHICSFLPAIGVLTLFLPDVEKKKPIKLEEVKISLDAESS